MSLPPVSLGSRWRRVSPLRWGWFVIAVVTAGIVVSPWAGQSRDRAHPRMATYVNERAGYALRYPTVWRLVESGASIKITDPDRQVIVSAGRSYPGSLKRATRQMLDLVASEYRDTAFTGSDLQSIGGRKAMLAGGTATNPAGLRLRFLVVTLNAGARNLALTIFTPVAGPSQIAADLDAIVESFRPL